MGASKSKLRAVAKRWNEAKHPRYPAGHPLGGKFMPKGSADYKKAIAAQSKEPDVIDGLTKEAYAGNLGRRSLVEFASKALERHPGLRERFATPQLLSAHLANEMNKMDEEPAPVKKSVSSKKAALKKSRAVKSKVAERSKKAEDTPLPVEGTVIGAGAHGRVVMTERGTVYKEGAIGGNERRLLEKAGKLGIAPKLVSSDSNGYEMEFLNGYKTVAEIVGDDPTAFNSSSRVAELASKMHRSGIVHGDFHWNNVMVKGDDARVIDFGLSEEVNLKDLDPDVGKEIQKQYRFFVETRRIAQIIKMSQSGGKDPASRAYIEAMEEIEDGNWLERTVGTNEKNHASQMREITLNLLRKLENV